MKKVKVITVGSGAQNVVNNKKAKKRFDVFAIDSEKGSGNDEEKGRQLAESMFGKLDAFVGGAKERVFVVSTLGGGTGTGATPVVVDHLAAMGIEIVTIVTMPLNFEGTLKYEKSRMVVRNSCKKCNMTIVINQENYMKQMGNKTIIDFFRVIDEEIMMEIERMCPRKKIWPFPWFQ